LKAEEQRKLKGYWSTHFNEEKKGDRKDKGNNNDKKRKLSVILVDKGYQVLTRGRESADLKDPRQVRHVHRSTLTTEALALSVFSFSVFW
jgi:hypothetical protein